MAWFWCLQNYSVALVSWVLKTPLKAGSKLIAIHCKRPITWICSGRLWPNFPAFSPRSSSSKSAVERKLWLFNSYCTLVVWSCWPQRQSKFRCNFNSFWLRIQMLGFFSVERCSQSFYSWLVASLLVSFKRRMFTRQKYIQQRYDRLASVDARHWRVWAPWPHRTWLRCCYKRPSPVRSPFTVFLLCLRASHAFCCRTRREASTWPPKCNTDTQWLPLHSRWTRGNVCEKEWCLIDYYLFDYQRIVRARVYVPFLFNCVIFIPH